MIVPHCPFYNTLSELLHAAVSEADGKGKAQLPEEISVPEIEIAHREHVHHFDLQLFARFIAKAVAELGAGGRALLSVAFDEVSVVFDADGGILLVIEIHVFNHGRLDQGGRIALVTG